MTATVFVDTSVFLFAHHANDPGKQSQAAHWLKYLWEEQTGRTSIQVLNEYYVLMTEKIHPALLPEEAWDFIRPLMAWNPQPTDADLLRRAHDLGRRNNLSWWDSLIVAGAQAQSCTLLLTETIPERMIFGNVIARNPFSVGVSEAMETYAAIPIVTPRHRQRGRPRKAA